MNDNFVMTIEERFYVSRGLVVTGLLHGTIRVGMPVAIQLPEGRIVSRVRGIEHDHQLYDELSAPYDDNSCGIGVLLPLPTIFTSESLRGYVLVSC